MVRWLEANGYHVSYFTGVDSDRRGNLIRNHKMFLAMGHDEYWSDAQRANVEAARNAGVHLAFFSGNEVYWKTRWENSIDGSGTPYRTLVCYKETHNYPNNPDPTAFWTGTWRDPRNSPPKDGGRPENALTGTLFTVNDGATTSIEVPAEDGKMRFWRNTSIANLAAGTKATLPFGTLGYEWDEDIDNGFRPAGLIRLLTTTVLGAPVLTDYGSTFGSGTATHSLTLYKHSSGALVFGAGTVQWSWGLDSNHDRTVTPTDSSMQQATINLFADMGMQPATLQPGLVTATASTDTTPPTSTITAPAASSTVPPGNVVTITGTASDAGGGIVGGVEVSVDGGTSWRRASGRANWTYDWTVPSATGSVTIRSRAADDSGNLEAPGAGITVTVGSGSDTTPSAVADTFLFRANIPRTVNYAGPLNLGVLANDTPTNQPLAAVAVGTLPTGVTLASTGVVTVNRSANTTFNYRAKNGILLSQPTTGAPVTLRLDAAPTTAGDNCNYDRSANTVTQPTRCTVTGTRVVRMNVVLNDTDTNVTTNIPTDGVGKTVVPSTMVITVAGAGVTVNANAACGQGALGTGTNATIVNNCDGTLTVTMSATNTSNITYSYRVSDDLGAQSGDRPVTLSSVQ